MHLSQDIKPINYLQSKTANVINSENDIENKKGYILFQRLI